MAWGKQKMIETQSRCQVPSGHELFSRFGFIILTITSIFLYKTGSVCGKKTEDRLFYYIHYM